jgi:predicted nucleic acid-binding protein
VKLVDASFLVDYARGDDAAISFLEAHDPAAVGASTIVLSELYRGLVVTRGMTREEAMTKYEWVDAIPFTDDTAAEAAEIYAELRDAGTLINRSDIYIAGTARSLGVPLVTDDGDFDCVDGLSVESY